MNLYLCKRQNGFTFYCVAESYAKAEILCQGVDFSKLEKLELIEEDIKIQSI